MDFYLMGIIMKHFIGKFATDHSLGSVNQNLGLTDVAVTDKDVETSTTTEPWQVSTNYIRNAPMKSFWELGAIHRGAAWQTLNLTTYNDLFIQQVASEGFGTYTNGDANILSQVKLTDDTSTTGRVNVNTYNHDVLSALFAGIEIGDEYDFSSSLAFYSN